MSGGGDGGRCEEGVFWKSKKVVKPESLLKEMQSASLVYGYQENLRGRKRAAFLRLCCKGSCVLLGVVRVETPIRHVDCTQYTCSKAKRDY